jgi:uncharacterized protein YabE (DUF348 family)/3D (Asp-Asp-Asp) domain-containing protein
VVLSPRNVTVVADGRELSIETYQSSDDAALRAAGVALGQGDRVFAVETPGNALVLQVDRARDVMVQADGRTHTLRTAADTVSEALDEAGVGLQERDSVVQDGVFVAPNAPLDSPSLLVASGLQASRAEGEPVSIVVRRAMPFVIVENGREIVSTSSRETIAQVLREAGIVVGPGDAVAPDLQAPLAAETRVDVQHANPVTIALPDGHRVVYTLANTVAEALDREGIVIPYGAFVNPGPETVITPNMRVRVIQLGSSADMETETIPYGTMYKTDPSLGVGETYTEEGHEGLIARRYAISYVDGVEVGRELLEEVVDPAVDTVVYYPPQRSAAEVAITAPETAVVGSTLRVYAVAYNAASAGRSRDDPHYGITATGVFVTFGVVAVDPNVIPLGTRMYIPGYGYGVAADTGGAVKGNIIDLGYPDGVPIDWVSQWVDIQILE